MRDGLMDRILSEIINSIALEIIETETDEVSNREGLYNLTKALKAVKGKLQECINDTIVQENE
jgi:hypothetical protein